MRFLFPIFFLLACLHATHAGRVAHSRDVPLNDSQRKIQEQRDTELEEMARQNALLRAQLDEREKRYAQQQQQQKTEKPQQQVPEPEPEKEKEVPLSEKVNEKKSLGAKIMLLVDTISEKTSEAWNTPHAIKSRNQVWNTTMQALIKITNTTDDNGNPVQTIDPDLIEKTWNATWQVVGSATGFVYSAVTSDTARKWASVMYNKAMNNFIKKKVQEKAERVYNYELHKNAAKEESTFDELTRQNALLEQELERMRAEKVPEDEHKHSKLQEHVDKRDKGHTVYDDPELHEDRVRDAFDDGKLSSDRVIVTDLDEGDDIIDDILSET